MKYYIYYAYDFSLIDSTGCKLLISGRFNLRQLRIEEKNLVQQYKTTKVPFLYDAEQQELRGKICSLSPNVTTQYAKAVFAIEEEVIRELYDEIKSVESCIGRLFEKLKEEGKITILCDSAFTEAVEITIKGRSQGEIDFAPLGEKLKSIHKDLSWITSEACLKWQEICKEKEEIKELKTLIVQQGILQQAKSFLASCSSEQRII